MTSLSETLIELVAYDHVLIAGTRVARPIGIGIEDWEGFWIGVRSAINEEEALKSARDNGYDDGYATGLAEGYDEGYTDGSRKGYDEGFNDCRREKVE